MTDTRLPSTRAHDTRSGPRTGRRMIRVLAGFAAGFVAVLLFHQGMLGLLHLAGLAARAPFQFHTVPPLGVPALLSSAFWGGVWGVALAGVAPRFPTGARHWLAAAAFGALGPTLVAWFVVAPLKGLPSGGGWGFPGVLIGPLVNGAWGVGTALLLRALDRTARK